VTDRAGRAGTEVRRDALANRDGLADVDDVPLRVAEEVDARLVRQLTPLVCEAQ